ncbi:MAG: WYL domain-containing protein, partial [Oscillospiraceae bacterium]|nr:WYL domain-containing protein [Oscillospiraceae bacterium]
ENNEAKWGFDAVEHKNTRKGEEENDDYAELVSTLRFAIVKGYAVRYDYQGRDTAIAFHDQLMYPRFFEYTANERLRLIAWCPVAGTFLRNTVGRISNLKIDKMARKVDLDDLWVEYLKTNQKEAVLELEPNEYALERMVRLFSCYERKMTYDRKRNKLIMTVKYMADERLDIMRAILSCGDYCQVTGPFDLVEGIYERVSRALKRLEQEQMRKRP